MEEQKKKKKKKKLFGIHYYFFRRVRLTFVELQNNSQSLNFTKTSNFGMYMYRIDKSLKILACIELVYIFLMREVFLDMN